LSGRVADLGIRIVDPRSRDAAALVTDFFAEIAARYPGFDPANQPPAPVEAFTRTRRGAFVVASLDREPVACAGLQRLDDGTAELRRVFVRETARGRGVARALLAAVIEAAVELGYERIRLDTGDRLTEAQALFRSTGFHDIDDYNGNPYADYWMELSPLPGAGRADTEA
jgi:GNAT superfamily N-acetyltransferase